MRRLYPEPDGEFDPRYRRPPFAPDPGTAGRFSEEKASVCGSWPVNRSEKTSAAKEMTK